MDVLFIILIVIVALGFLIIACVGCYCLCCRPRTSYSSSSHYSSGHGGYKESSTFKSGDYNNPNWNSSATLPLMTPLNPPDHYPPASISSFSSRKAEPIMLEQSLADTTNQGIDVTGGYPYGSTYAERQTYQTSQEAVNKTSKKDENPFVYPSRYTTSSNSTYESDTFPQDPGRVTYHVTTTTEYKPQLDYTPASTGAQPPNSTKVTTYTAERKSASPHFNSVPPQEYPQTGRSTTQETVTTEYRRFNDKRGSLYENM